MNRLSKSSSSEATRGRRSVVIRDVWKAPRDPLFRSIRSYWVEVGRWHPAPGWWLRLGPFVVELHLDRWAFGVVVARWYVGAFAGPFVATFGKRHWVEKTTATTWTAETFTITTGPPAVHVSDCEAVAPKDSCGT